MSGEGRACPICEVDEVGRYRMLLRLCENMCRVGENMVETEGIISNQVQEQTLSTLRHTLIFRK